MRLLLWRREVVAVVGLGGGDEIYLKRMVLLLDCFLVTGTCLDQRYCSTGFLKTSRSMCALSGERLPQGYPRCCKMD